MKTDGSDSTTQKWNFLLGPMFVRWIIPVATLARLSVSSMPSYEASINELDVLDRNLRATLGRISSLEHDIDSNSKLSRMVQVMERARTKPIEDRFVDLSDIRDIASLDEGLKILSDLSYLVDEVSGHPSSTMSPLAAQASLHVTVERTLRKELEQHTERFVHLLEDIRARGSALLTNMAETLAGLQDSLVRSRVKSRDIQLMQSTLLWRTFVVRDCIAEFGTRSRGGPYIPGIDTDLLGLVQRFIENPLQGQLLTSDSVFAKEFKEKVILKRKYDTFTAINEYMDRVLQDIYPDMEPISEEIDELEATIHQLRHSHEYVSHLLESVSEL